MLIAGHLNLIHKIAKMSNEILPLSVVAKRLEHCSGYEFQCILRTLKSPKYVNQQLLKSDLSVLIAKLLKLLRSNDDYHVWKGCHVAAVLCSYNPVVLSSHADGLLHVIYSKVEQKAQYYSSTVGTPQGKVTLINLVRTIGILMDLVRGKPALTREALTPKLGAIIPTLVSLSQFEPQLCLPIIKKLLLRSTTTFRPHINKFRAVLLNLLLKDYHHFDKSTRRLISDCFAYLHLIKQNVQAKDDNQSHHKSFQDDNWRMGLLSILFQFKPVISLCNELLDFNADSDMSKLVESLPKPPSGTNSFEEIFPSLSVDMNSPMTLWDIVERLSTLVDLTISFISVPTPYAIRVPLGGIISVCETMLALTTTYLPLQRGLRRDAELTSTINDIFPQIQWQAIRMLNHLTGIYGKCVLAHLPSLIASVESFIPLKHGSMTVDLDRIQALRGAFVDVFELAATWISYMGHSFDETTFFTKLVEVSLCLTDDINPLNDMFVVLNRNSRKQAQTKKQKNASKSYTGSMSDLYSHPKSFVCRSSLRVFNAVNKFLITICSFVRLPSNQQIKVIKNAIIIAVKQKAELGYIPKSFINLLRTLVLYPGNERVTILPIAVTLLKDCGDDVFNAICNPRLPMGAVQIVEETQALGADLNSATIQYPEPSSPQTLESSEHAEVDVNKGSELEHSMKCDVQEDIQMTEEETKATGIVTVDKITTDTTKIFKKRVIESEESNEHPAAKQLKISEPEEVTNTVKEVILETDLPASTSYQKGGPEDGDEDDDSEFEIPAIELSEDEDD